MNRREWLAMIAAAPLVKAAPQTERIANSAPATPVAIGKAVSYDDKDVTAKLATMFQQLGGIEKLVKNKTVAIKLNLTGAPTNRLQGIPPGFTHWTSPTVTGAVTHLLGRAGARRIRIVESSANTIEPLEETLAKGEWDVKAIQNAAKVVEFENTVGLGLGKKYSRLQVGPGAYMFPAWDVNHSYEEMDVLVSIGKLKNHSACGVTLAMKNLFGCLPASIYGNDAGENEPNENPKTNRSAVGHQGRRAPSKCSPGELAFGTNNDTGYRMPRVVADLVAAMPIHLAIIDGIETIAGGALPRPNSRVLKPGVLIAGTNPVCTDSVATAVMGYNPRAMRDQPGFPNVDNAAVLCEQRGLGSTDLKRIEVRGVSIEQALCRFDA